MIRYKIMCENNTLLCEKKENNQLTFIKNEETFIDLAKEFIRKGYTITVNGKDLILNGDDAYFYLKDYHTILSSLSMSDFRKDLVSRIESDGVFYSTAKKGKKRSRNRRNRNFTIDIPDYDSNIKYYSNKKPFMFKTFLHHFLEYTLLATLSFGVIRINSDASENFYKNREVTDGSIDVSEPYLMTINEALNLRPINGKMDVYAFEEELVSAPDTLAPEETLEVDIENHDDEYRESIYNFLVKEEMNLDQFSSLLSSMIEGNSPFPFTYKNEAEVFKDICFREERSIEEKMLITMVRDNITYDELDSVCAGCVSESCLDGECYDDAYAVASTFLNRINDVYYRANYGTNPYNQFIAPNQYSVYANGDYLNYLGRRDLLAYQAAVDALYSKESMHQYLEFRAYWVDVPYHHESFVDGGNQFLVKQKDSRVIVDEEFVVDKDEVMSLTLDY